MIKLYFASSCASCRRAKEWLINNGLEYEEHNLMTCPLEPADLIEMLSLTDNGTEDIICMRGKEISKLNLNLDELSLNDVFELIKIHPKILRRPILVNEHHLQVGFNSDDIRIFIPREIRRVEISEAIQNIKIEL